LSVENEASREWSGGGPARVELLSDYQQNVYLAASSNQGEVEIGGEELGNYTLPGGPLSSQGLICIIESSGWMLDNVRMGHKTRSRKPLSNARNWQEIGQALRQLWYKPLLPSQVLSPRGARRSRSE
jgi:hypothetical protein